MLTFVVLSAFCILCILPHFVYHIVISVQVCVVHCRMRSRSGSRVSSVNQTRFY